MAGGLCTLLVACSGGGVDHAPVGSGSAGAELAKPGGGTFFLDPHRSGRASVLHVVGIQWGRLVDVHDLGPGGEPNSEPVFEDLVVDENVISDGSNYTLERNPVTQRARLVIQRTRGEPAAGSGTFETLLADATAALAPVAGKADDGSDPGPFSLLARNATLVVRFDDLLDDDPLAVARLSETVRVLTGYPPRTPFSARILFDPNHGGIVAGAFHSTRILVDLTVSGAESNDMPAPLPINALGPPPSHPGSPDPSMALRFPTRIDPGSGQFSLLRNLGGSPLGTQDNGAVDLASPGVDVVRAARAGRDDDANQGFLLDPELPRVVGSWSVLVTDVEPAVGSAGGALHRVKLRFRTGCRTAPARGDILVVGSHFLEVSRSAGDPDAQGEVADVEVLVLSGGEVSTPAALLGAGVFSTAYDPGIAVHPICWFDVFPPPSQEPAGGVSASAQFMVRFSEPMRPASVRAFETFRVVRGTLGAVYRSRDVVIADLSPSADLREYLYAPILPLSNAGTLSYVLSLTGGLGGVTDLSGNALADALPEVEIGLDDTEPVVGNGGVILLFDARDELEPLGTVDLRGQLIQDLDRGTLTGRQVLRASLPVDQGQATVSLMTPFFRGIQTPLSPLGSKMQSVWRYVDLGWRVRDETKYDIDIIGMGWSSASGRVLADYYGRFEMLLAHSRFVTEERGSPSPVPELGPAGQGRSLPGKRRPGRRWRAGGRARPQPRRSDSAGGPLQERQRNADHSVSHEPCGRRADHLHLA